MLERQVELFEKQGKEPDTWLLTPAKDKLYINAALWEMIPFEQFQTFVSYSEAKILPAISYRRPFVEVPLTRNKKVFIERMRVRGEYRDFSSDHPSDENRRDHKF